MKLKDALTSNELTVTFSEMSHFYAQLEASFISYFVGNELTKFEVYFCVLSLISIIENSNISITFQFTSTRFL